MTKIKHIPEPKRSVSDRVAAYFSRMKNPDKGDPIRKHRYKSKETGIWKIVSGLDMTDGEISSEDGDRRTLSTYSGTFRDVVALAVADNRFYSQGFTYVPRIEDYRTGFIKKYNIPVAPKSKK
jgi:hypothetical protein